jgi:hypothetical protein
MHQIVSGKIFVLFCCFGYTVHAGASTNRQHYGAAVSTLSATLVPSQQG